MLWLSERTNVTPLDRGVIERNASPRTSRIDVIIISAFTQYLLWAIARSFYRAMTEIYVSIVAGSKIAIRNVPDMLYGASDQENIQV